MWHTCKRDSTLQPFCIHSHSHMHLPLMCGPPDTRYSLRHSGPLPRVGKTCSERDQLAPHCHHSWQWEFLDWLTLWMMDWVGHPAAPGVCHSEGGGGGGGWNQPTTQTHTGACQIPTSAHLLNLASPVNSQGIQYSAGTDSLNMDLLHYGGFHSIRDIVMNVYMYLICVYNHNYTHYNI